MVALTPSRHFSANVQLHLHVGTSRIPLAQIGGNRLVFTEPVVLEGTTGEVRAQIDQNEHRWRVTWLASVEARKAVPADYTCLS